VKAQDRVGSFRPLPPNRTGGSPASGFPVGGLTSKRGDPADSCRIRLSVGIRDDSRHRPFGGAPWSIPTADSTNPVTCARHDPRGLVPKDTRYVENLMLLSPAIHLPTSLRSPGITRLHRYYGRSDSCSAGLGGLWPIGPAVPMQVSLFRCRVFRSFCLQPPLTPTLLLLGFCNSGFTA